MCIVIRSRSACTDLGRGHVMCDGIVCERRFAGCTQQQVLGSFWHDLLGLGKNHFSEGLVVMWRFGGNWIFSTGNWKYLMKWRNYMQDLDLS